MLSIVICTYNRSILLRKCLDSLLPQINHHVEILVIDNNSNDETGNVTSDFMKKMKNLRYISEYEAGLSHARNRGLKESNSDWILFLDDDGIAFPTFVERALYLVENGQFDCVGGMYYGYFDGEKPKWIDINYGSKIKFSESLSKCPFIIPSGGVVLYRRKIIEDLGGFNTKFGMNGERIGFAEESELQKRMEDKGYQIGFDPLLQIHHLTNRKKLTLRWQLYSSFARGRDSNYLNIGIPYNIVMSIKSFIGLIFLRIPKNISNLIFKKNYYWQNLVIDSFHPNIYYLGRIYKQLHR